MDLIYKASGQLNEAAKEIRVMRIKSSCQHSEDNNDGDTIICSLERVQLAHANPYYALSYVWGPETPVEPIIVDGHKVKIRRNLWLFLRLLRRQLCQRADDPRRTSQTPRLWADSLCIHQNDLRERSYQVSIMGEIYRGADAVYGWLGNLENLFDEGPRCIEAVGELRAQNVPWIHIHRERSSSDTDLQSMAASVYWSRLWIKQEVILAKDVWFFYGSNVFHWKDIRFTAKLKLDDTRQLPGRRRTNSMPFERQKNATKMPKQAMTSLLDLRAMKPRTFDLSELLNKFYVAECHDARDRIYALLSLTHEATREDIVVDYRKPLLQILLETYHLWSGEANLLRQSREQNPETLCPCYQYHSFCSHIAMVLPSAELKSLCMSENARNAVTAKASFMTSTPTEIVSVDRIAWANNSDIWPIFDGSDMPSVPCTLVLQVIVINNLSAGQPEHRRRYYIYAKSAPEVGQLLAHIGPCVFFFRVAHFQGDDGLTYESRLELASIAADAQQLAKYSHEDDRLSVEMLLHPCFWTRHRLSDASFEMVESVPWSRRRTRTSGKHRVRAKIVCNSAALVTLLLASGKFDDHDAVETDESRTLWSPYTFGLQHGILEPCPKCKTTGRGFFGTQRQQLSMDRAIDCECMWITRSSSLVAR